MILLITGGSASGKSEYAEARACALAGHYRTVGVEPPADIAQMAGAEIPATVSDSSARYKLLYLATMKPFGEEAYRRIRRHQRLREGKGFETVERYTDIKGLCEDDVPESRRFREKAAGSVVLLECMSNLTANELFDEKGAGKDAEQAILEGIRVLGALCAHLVIVSIDIFGDGRSYDAETENYIRCLGRLNRQLAAVADEVVEVVYGIPLIIS